MITIQIILLIFLIILAILLYVNRESKLKWLHRAIFIIALIIFIHGVLTVLNISL